VTGELFTTAEGLARLVSGSSWLVVDDRDLVAGTTQLSSGTVPVVVVTAVDQDVDGAVPLWTGEDPPPAWVAVPELGAPRIAACVLRHPVPLAFASWCSATGRPAPPLIAADDPEVSSRIAAALVAAAEDERSSAVSALAESTALLADLRVELQRVYSAAKQANLRYHAELALLLPRSLLPDGQVPATAPSRPAQLGSPAQLVHTLFDRDFYAAGSSRGAASDPLGHYRRKGWRQGRDPLPLFSVDWYLSTAGARRQVDEPLLDYLTEGYRAGMTPHPLFDDSWYRRQVDVDPDVPPLVHYLTVGWRAGVSPHPLFDLRWYCKTNSDSLRPDEEPLGQYLKVGWRRGQDPHPLFQVDHYLQTYTDVAAAGIDPLSHYVRYGWRENRQPHPMFSTEWYRAQNADLEPFEMDPLAHFLTVGWRWLRDPHPLFSMRSYAERYPAVWAAGLNPLVDFVTTGLHEGRTSTASEALGVGVLSP
jgi:hypothetical protein